jgi:hypothetical protein
MLQLRIYGMNFNASIFHYIHLSVVIVQQKFVNYAANNIFTDTL